MLFACVVNESCDGVGLAHRPAYLPIPDTAFKAVSEEFPILYQYRNNSIGRGGWPACTACTEASVWLKVSGGDGFEEKRPLMVVLGWMCRYVCRGSWELGFWQSGLDCSSKTLTPVFLAVWSRTARLRYFQLSDASLTLSLSLALAFSLSLALALSRAVSLFFLFLWLLLSLALFLSSFSGSLLLSLSLSCSCSLLLSLPLSCFLLLSLYVSLLALFSLSHCFSLSLSLAPCPSVLFVGFNTISDEQFLLTLTFCSAFQQKVCLNQKHTNIHTYACLSATNNPVFGGRGVHEVS